MLPTVPGATVRFGEPQHVRFVTLARAGDHADQIDWHEPLERARHDVEHARKVATRVCGLRHGEERLVTMRSLEGVWWSPSVTQDDFPVILAAIGEQNRREFSRRADRPD